MLDFFERVWGEAPGFRQFVQRREDDKGNRTGPPTETKAFRWPRERDNGRIERYLESRMNEDLYFAVPAYSKSLRQKEFATTLNAVFVDDDGVTEGRYRVEPSIKVFSSPGHKHCYWVLDKPCDAERVTRLGQKISAAHKHDNEFHADMGDHPYCGTDPGGWDITQILRVPGTLNMKPEYRQFGEIRIDHEDNGTVFTLEELEELYKDVQVEYVSIESPDAVPADIPSHIELMQQLGSRPDLIDLFMQEPTGRGNAQGWDERLFAFESELFRLGFTAREVYALAWDAACNKFKRGIRQPDGVSFKPRPNPELDLWRDVLKAEAGAGNRESNWTPDMATAGGPEASLSAQTRVFASARKPFEIQLLTEEEEARVENTRTIVDKYLEWATSKTDAAEVYHIASIFTILSVVYGEFGHAMPKFGKLRLNLWFLVLGKTTRARKSTSRALMLKIIDGITAPNYRYDEGSDFTAEGLSNALLEKPRQSSLIHRDEVQGMFKEANGKSYMSGLTDFLTDLYDGIVRGKKRATGDIKNAEKVETNFVMFLMGIVGEVTSVLTLKDFQTGFLTRFIHVIGEAPIRTRDTEWLDQASRDEILRGDPLYREITSGLQVSRSKWSTKVPDRYTVPIWFTEEAWKRWNEANWDLQQSILDHDRGEVLEAAFDRLGKSAIKAAALIAMSQDRDEANVDDILVALHFVQIWSKHVVQSAELVSESFFQKDMQDLYAHIIAKGGALKWEDAFSKMRKEPGQFKNLVEGMVMQGLIHVRIDEKSSSKTRYLEAA